MFNLNTCHQIHAIVPIVLRTRPRDLRASTVEGDFIYFKLWWNDPTFIIS